MTRRLPSATSAAASASVTDNLAARSLPRAPIPTALLGTLGSLSLALITANAWAAPPAKPATVVPARAKTPQQPAPAPRPTLGPGGIHSLPPALLSAPTLPKNYAPTPQATPPGTLPPLPPLPTIPPLPNLNFAQGPARAQAATFSSGDEDGGEEDLAGRVKDLETQLEQTRDLVVGRQPIVTLHGHVDFGFFAAQGDGSGIVRDTGNTIFPEYANQYGWVFLGDLLAPTVNSRGEVADLGDAAGAPRFDSIHSRGAPGFLLNEVNLTANAGLSPQVLGTASVNFIPRTGRDFGLGDFMEVDIAQVEWMPTASGKTSVFVGKFDSLIGIEYRDRKATQRFGITPSLLARYTTGTALGLKVRSKFGTGDWLVLAGAVTNGSNGTEQFHFYNEVDTNAGKTASGRIALHYPGDFELELGVSGSYGAQDRARDSRHPMWIVGVDLMGHVGGIDIKAQWLKGKAPGQPADDVYGLDLKNGGYLELDWMLTGMFGIVARGEFRDALVWLGDPGSMEGANRAYVTKSWRGTLGAKAILHQRIALKFEYLHNGEYGAIPGIRNDVFTSSLLFSF